jgi:hypothetical protein
MTLLRRLFGVLLRPRKVFGEIREERLGHTFLYLTAILVPSTLLLIVGGLIVRSLFIAPWLGDRQHLGWLGVALIAPCFLVPTFAGLLAGGLVLEPFVYILGGRQGIAQTLKALVYSSTPVILSLWFPPILGLTVAWSLVLTIVGLNQIQGISFPRATLSVLLPLVIVTIPFLAIGLAASR